MASPEFVNLVDLQTKVKVRFGAFFRVHKSVIYCLIHLSKNMSLLAAVPCEYIALAWGHYEACFNTCCIQMDMELGWYGGGSDGLNNGVDVYRFSRI